MSEMYNGPSSGTIVVPEGATQATLVAKASGGNGAPGVGGSHSGGGGSADGGMGYAGGAGASGWLHVEFS